MIYFETMQVHAAVGKSVSSRRTSTSPEARMSEPRALECFAALSQESRLAIVRLLIKEAPNGLPVGEISRRLDILQSTLSSHLGVLRRAELVKSTRHQREIHYAARLDGMRAMIRFLLQDCCQGNADKCDKLLSLVVCA